MYLALNKCLLHRVLSIFINTITLPKIQRRRRVALSCYIDLVPLFSIFNVSLKEPTYTCLQLVILLVHLSLNILLLFNLN